MLDVTGNLRNQTRTMSRSSLIRHRVDIGDARLMIEITNREAVEDWKMVLKSQTTCSIFAVAFFETEDEALNAIPGFMGLVYPIWNKGGLPYPKIAHVTIDGNGTMKMDIVDKFQHRHLECF